ncbi:MAG: hypothetical protein COA32_10500 [Fluviicola sp.]|nr:MAG: hypothetical protein COA32_10500 [Fluviicola sp.]
MSELISKGYINKKDKDSGQYEELYLEGIELLQKLSGAQWTDYNEHDPGVTILENIAYTMTDLSNKASQPIKDILVESKGGKLESGDNGFFIPSDILTTNPITVNDFRKVFIDGVTNVKNVWIKSQNQQSEKSFQSIQKNLKGLYHIFIEMYDYSTDPVELQDEEDRVIHEIRELFHTHRNLCEDLYKVTIFKPFQLHMRLKVTLGNIANGEEVFANIFFKVSDYLTHEVRFYSLWELQQQKEDVNTIFNGPSLENGFIDDSELRGRLNRIVPSDIIKIIANEEGVISVDFFELSYENSTSEKNNVTPISEEGFIIPENCSPVLVFPENKIDQVFEHEGVQFFPDLKEVQKQLAYVEVMNYGSFKSVSQAFNTLEIPAGQSFDLASYYPLRKQFPVHYGIGEYGLPTDLPEKRYAQANQLKAYLLPFDQLMTNFLGQLTSLYQIFNANTKELHSYFYQELDDMPELTQLIKTSEDESKEESLDNWSNTLRTLNNRFDSEALQRLNQVADHLLARYSEQFPTYSLKKIHINSYGKKLTTDKFEDELLEWKRTLIANYGKLSYNRAKAYDYTQKVNITDNTVLEEVRESITPGIVQKTAILMGIRNYKARYLTQVIADSGIKIYQKKEGMEIISEKLEIVHSKSDIEVITVDDIVIIDETVENLRDSFYYLGHSGTILKDVLRNGVKIENYQIKQTTNDKKNSFYVLYKGEKQSNVVHISDSKVEAMQAINYSVNFLLDLNQKSEGIYLVEHILLAPPYHGNYFGFSFSIPMLDGKMIEFIQVKLQSNGDRNVCVDKVVSNLVGSGNLQLRVIGKGDGYVIRVLTKAGNALAVTANSYDDKQTAQEEADNIVKQFYTFEKEQFKEKVSYYAYYGDKKVDETFYSFQMSMIMPSWPVRFQDHNFRTKLTNITYEQAPIHIAFQSFWLDLMEMIHFEKVYYKWLGLVSNNEYAEEQMTHAYELITKIQQYNQKSQ